MPRANDVPDKAIQQKLSQKLSRLVSGSRNAVTAVVRNGVVTVSGFIQFQPQRRLILRAMQSITGVRQVIDNIQIQARKSNLT